MGNREFLNNLGKFWHDFQGILGKPIWQHWPTVQLPTAWASIPIIHCSLKAALMSRSTTSVLLRFCITPKEGLDSSPAQVVLDDALFVPSEFFLPHQNHCTSEEPDHIYLAAEKYYPGTQTYSDLSSFFIINQTNEKHWSAYDLIIAQYLEFCSWHKIWPL